MPPELTSRAMDKFTGTTEQIFMVACKLTCIDGNIVDFDTSGNGYVYRVFVDPKGAPYLVCSPEP